MATTEPGAAGETRTISHNLHLRERAYFLLLQHTFSDTLMHVRNDSQ